jgi:DNA polymerase-1
MAKLMLIDGNSILYRAFFALPTDMATASGQVTNAVFGFTRMLIILVRDHHPDQLVATFDRPEPTFRHDRVDAYKAGRAETPDILRQQMGLARQLVEALAIPMIDWPGFEADDVIATLATQAAARGDDVIVVSGDRDTYQLVQDPHVRVLYPKRGVTEYALYDEAGIEERTGVKPVVYPQYAALRGDPSDNLPGVPGVGEKTAAKLINTYGGLDGIFDHLDDLTPKLRQSLADSEAQVRSNAGVTPLVRDVPVQIDTEAAALGGWDLAELRRLFDFLEFNTLWDPLMEATGTDKGTDAAPATPTSRIDVAVERLEGPGGAIERVNSWRSSGADLTVAGAWSGREGRSELLGLAFVVLPAGETVHAVWLDGEWLSEPALAVALDGLLGRDGARVSCHDAKALMRGLMARGITFSNLELDPAIAAYLVDPAGDQYLLEELAARYAGVELAAVGATPSGQLDLMATAADPAEDASRRAAAVARLVEPLSAALSARGMSNLYDEVERPLVRVLAEMEAAGVRVDVAALQRLADELGAEARRLEREIQDLAGVDFVVNSTPSCARFSSASSAWPRRRRPRPATRRTPRPWRSCGASTPSSRPCCATAKWRSCARPTASRSSPRWAWTSASGPRSTRRWPAPGVCHPTSPTFTTSRSAARRAGASAAASSRPRVVASWSPTTTRSSYGSSPTWPRTRPWSRRSAPERTSTTSPPPASTASTPRT